MKHGDERYGQSTADRSTSRHTYTVSSHSLSNVPTDEVPDERMRGKRRRVADDEEWLVGRLRVCEDGGERHGDAVAGLGKGGGEGHAEVSKIAMFWLAGDESAAGQMRRDASRWAFIHSDALHDGLERSVLHLTLPAHPGTTTMSDQDPIHQFFTDQELVSPYALYTALALPTPPPTAPKDAIKQALEAITPADIRTSYRRAALKYHPDKHASKEEGERKEMERAFQRVGFAFAVLSDEARRKR